MTLPSEEQIDEIASAMGARSNGHTLIATFYFKAPMMNEDAVVDLEILRESLIDFPDSLANGCAIQSWDEMLVYLRGLSREGGMPAVCAWLGNRRRLTA